MQYQYRTIEPKLANYAKEFALVGLKGPVGAGKTTLLVNKNPEHEYFNFEDPRTILRYRQDPERFIRQLSPKAILDEVQHAPALINQLAGGTWDKERFILTSSCLFQSIRGIDKKVLAKVKMLTLLPYQLIEIPNHLREDSIYLGCFPEPVSQHYEYNEDWYANYIQQNLVKQLPTIGMVSNQQEFQRLLHLLASHTAKPLNMSIYAEQLSVDVKTIKRWIELLAASFIIFLVPAYHHNFGKRHIKSPKLYFYDTGLVSYLTGIETERQFEYGPLASSIFENHVVVEILKKTVYEAQPAQLYYFLTNHGVGIDLIIEQGSKRYLICISFNETFRIRMVSPIETFKQEHDLGYLIYNGIDLPYRDNIHIHNISTYLHST